MSGDDTWNPANFANLPREEVAEIGRKGGEQGFATRPPDETWNPTNFANLPHDELSEIARKGGEQGFATRPPDGTWKPTNFANLPHEEVSGGQHSHEGGFASMDSEKQVRRISKIPIDLVLMHASQHDIASKGGHSSSGSFEKGSERAKEAGHEGGLAPGGSFEPGSERAKEAGHKGGLSSDPGES